MKNIQSSNNSGFFKKIFIKICRILGFEIIDQNTFKIVTLDKKINDEISVIGKNSINLIHELKGVGENLRDHIVPRLIFEIIA